VHSFGFEERNQVKTFLFRELKPQLCKFRILKSLLVPFKRLEKKFCEENSF